MAMRRWRDDETQFLIIFKHPEDVVQFTTSCMTEKQIGTMLANAVYGIDRPEFTIWDVDVDGQPVECKFVDEGPLTYDSDDYADLQVRIVRPDGMVVGTAFARVDGRA
jgi:hypothetical protein